MPTLGELHRAICPAAEVAAPGPADAMAAPVGWVRVMKALTPAFDALEPEDLAIVPERALARLASDVEEPEAVVATVHAAGAAGLLLVGDEAADGRGALATRVVERAAALGLPVLRLATGEPTQLERAVIGYLVNARAELDRQAAALEGQLERLALTGAGPDEYAATIATFVGRAVALEAEGGHVLAVHAPPQPPTAARAAARYLADPREVARRVPLVGAGALALLGPGPTTELEATVVRRIGPVLALALGRVGAAARPARARPEGLPAAGPPWVVLMARQLVGGESGQPAAREALRGRVRRLAGPRHLSLRGDADSLELRVIAAPPPSDPLALELAGRIATAGARLVAVSRPFDNPEGRALAEADARSTLEVAARLPAFATGPCLARADRLAAYRLVGDLHSLPDGAEEARTLLAPVLVGGAARQARQVATLRAILEHPGPAAAAAALGIHRNTMGYRLRSLERTTGWQLDDPDLRLALLIALRFVQSDLTGEA